MPRRALRKIDPRIDLSGRLLRVESLPEDWRPSAVFPADTPLELEVGSGKGLFLETACLANPGRNLIGVEIAEKYAQACAARLVRHGLNNGLALHGDALFFIRNHVDSATLDAAHVYFPDPWWKKRHRKRRVMNAQLMGDFCRTLKPGGELHFWTDVLEYFEVSLELISQFPSLVGPLPVEQRPAEHDLDYQTHFERRTRKAELPVYRSRFVHTPAPAG